MGPWIRPCTILQETSSQVVAKPDFGAILHKRFEFPMPEIRTWQTDSLEKLEHVEFDASRDRRHYYEAGDNHVGASVTASSPIPRHSSRA